MKARPVVVTWRPRSSVESEVRGGQDMDCVLG